MGFPYSQWKVLGTFKAQSICKMCPADETDCVLGAYVSVQFRVPRLAVNG